MATTGEGWIIPSFRIWCYVLRVEHVTCAITNCGQHQWAIPSLFSIALQVLLVETFPENYYPYLDMFFKVLLLHVTFLIFFSIAFFSPCSHGGVNGPSTGRLRFGWSSIWHSSNTGSPSQQSEQTSILLGSGHFVWPSFLFWIHRIWRGCG